MWFILLCRLQRWYWFGRAHWFKGKNRWVNHADIAFSIFYVWKKKNICHLWARQDDVTSYLTYRHKERVPYRITLDIISITEIKYKRCKYSLAFLGYLGHVLHPLWSLNQIITTMFRVWLWALNNSSSPNIPNM